MALEKSSGLMKLSSRETISMERNTEMASSSGRMAPPMPVNSTTMRFTATVPISGVMGGSTRVTGTRTGCMDMGPLRGRMVEFLKAIMSRM